MFIAKHTQWERRAETGHRAPGGGGYQGLIMMVVIFAIFYFILIRPQQKKMKEHKKMVEELKKGDEIVTSGGIYGTVEECHAGNTDDQDRRRGQGEGHPRIRGCCGEARRRKK